MLYSQAADGEHGTIKERQGFVMDETKKDGRDYIGYEYYEIRADAGKISMYLDSYECFGWEPDENSRMQDSGRSVIRLKRNRKIVNKQELIRLQRHFEDCINQIEQLEKRKMSKGTMISIAVGILGTACMAGSVFAVTAAPPVIWLCILLAVPGILCWIAPVYAYRYLVEKETNRIQPMIEDKMEEIYGICEKGHSLLK